MSQAQPALDIDTTLAPTPAQQERDRMREVYRARLAEKLKDPEFRKIEGFPIGTDEAILALSDPPFYTACPNPFLEEWLAENATPYDAATDDYHREPFAADVSEGKNDPIYNAHSYHTKVPHKAIMRYILHYTEPGDVVYDGFCGTGMTGVAAQMCGNKEQVESLGYAVRADGAVLDADGQQISRLGARKAILNDLSPAATFIAYNYNTSVDAAAFEREADHVLAEVMTECGWMYTTLHEASDTEVNKITAAVRACSSSDELKALYTGLLSQDSPFRDRNSRLQLGRVNYMVWSDVFICPSCGAEMIYWDVALDYEKGDIRDVFQCPTCRADTTKRKCGRAFLSRFDPLINDVARQTKQVSVLVNYSAGKSKKGSPIRHEKTTDTHDSALAEAITRIRQLNNYESRLIMGKGERWGDTYRAGYCEGITHTHQFFTTRGLDVFSVLWFASKNQTIRAALIGGFSVGLKMSRFRVPLWFNKSSGPMKGATSGVIYFPSLTGEQNWLSIFSERVLAISRQLKAMGGLGQSGARISTGSASANSVPTSSVDYIFSDPPFGGNLQYSELNYLAESWQQTFTNITTEAVANNSQGKRLQEYQDLMAQCFAEYYRVLRPGHWMTIEFHNSANSVWNAIQEALQYVGFIVADVRTLDKQQHGFNGVVAASAVKQDLVISCYKPRADFELRFQQLKGQPKGVLEFVRQHLSMLPIAPINKIGNLQPVAERTRFLLFDRMIAYHLQRGAPIPMNSADFYKLLEDQFPARDEMYFLPDQAARFDALKSRGYETEQLSIFLEDEKSAVQWVRAALTETPQTLGDLTPKFMQELREWPAHEPRPELRDLLREYFIQSNSGVWRVPNPDDEKDIEALRRSELLRLFQGYTREKGALKTFRKEAVTEGFKQCYETNQYGVIVAVCEKIPEKVLQEIPEFVMFYDIAKDLALERVEQTEFVWE